MKNTILKVLEQKYYDRYVFITYANDEIIGLNFWQGIGKEIYELAMRDKVYEPCIHLTEIYNRLKITYETISNEERIDKAINLYTNAFIIQDRNCSKPTSTNVLIFNDVNDNELKIGDKVACVDVDDLDYPLPKGLILQVTELIDLESNLIEFKSIDKTYTFYGHRVLKLKL
jgi:hypothetical protein